MAALDDPREEIARLRRESPEAERACTLLAEQVIVLIYEPRVEADGVKRRLPHDQLVYLIHRDFLGGSI